MDSSDCSCYRSSTAVLISEPLTKRAIHDFNGRVVFAAKLSNSAFACGRSNWDFGAKQTEIRDMLESASLNLFAEHGLEQLRLRIL